MLGRAIEPFEGLLIIPQIPRQDSGVKVHGDKIIEHDGTGFGGFFRAPKAEPEWMPGELKDNVTHSERAVLKEDQIDPDGREVICSAFCLLSSHDRLTRIEFEAYFLGEVFQS
jgi:hypothetical protein